MIRQEIKNHIGMSEHFRYRGEEQTRIETFSDAVFALAITLLIVSSEVPDNFSEMRLFVLDILPFGLCMAFIVYVWYEHYLFFIRFGFRSKKIVVLNALLLFFILLYVYPLKFLAKILVGIYGNMVMKVFGGAGSFPSVGTMIKGSEMAELMIIYGLGAALIFLMLILMYRYALKHKSVLGLSEIEVFETSSSLQSHVIMGSVPVLSVLIAVVFGHTLMGSIISGLVYMLYWPLFPVWSRIRRKKQEKLFPELKS